MPVHRGLIENFKLTSWIDTSNAARLIETFAIFGYASVALGSLKATSFHAIIVRLQLRLRCLRFIWIIASRSVQAAQIPNFSNRGLAPRHSTCRRVELSTCVCVYAFDIDPGDVDRDRRLIPPDPSDQPLERSFKSHCQLSLRAYASARVCLYCLCARARARACIYVYLRLFFFSPSSFMDLRCAIISFFLLPIGD